MTTPMIQGGFVEVGAVHPVMRCESCGEVGKMFYFEKVSFDAHRFRCLACSKEHQVVIPQSARAVSIARPAGGREVRW